MTASKPLSLSIQDIIDDKTSRTPSLRMLL